MLTIHVYWLMRHKVFFMPMTSRHRLVHGSFRLNFCKGLFHFQQKSSSITRYDYKFNKFLLRALCNFSVGNVNYVK